MCIRKSWGMIIALPLLVTSSLANATVQRFPLTSGEYFSEVGKSILRISIVSDHQIGIEIIRKDGEIRITGVSEFEWKNGKAFFTKFAGDSRLNFKNGLEILQTQRGLKLPNGLGEFRSKSFNFLNHDQYEKRQKIIYERQKAQEELLDDDTDILLDYVLF